MSVEKEYYPIKINYLDHTISYKIHESSNETLKAKFEVLQQDTNLFGYNIVIDRLQYEYDPQEEEDIVDAIVDRIKLDNYLTGSSVYRYSKLLDRWEVRINPEKEKIE